MRSLKSSVERLGDKVTQIIHFSQGNKRTLNGVLTKTIKQGEMTKFELSDGRMILINQDNVDLVEVFKE